MVRIEVNDLGQEEWTGIIDRMEGLSLMQTWEFGEAKRKTGPWKVSRAVLKTDDNRVIGAAQAMIREIPFIRRGLVWMNRAPLFQDRDMIRNGLYEAMLKALRNYWVDDKHMYLRITPPLEASPDNYSLLNDAGFRRTREADGAASDIVDLTLPVEDLRKRLQQKWRNCLNKAERMGTACEIGSSESLMDELLADYRSLLAEKGFCSSATPELITAIQDALPERRKMVVLAGRNNGERLGSILIAGYGDTCQYLVGASNANGHRFNVNHFLLWNAACEMKRRGYARFDMGGVHPDDTPPGILHFKKGMNGTHYQLVCELEAGRNTLVNKIIRKKILDARRPAGQQKE
jgi:lipid II:glycine glycyltransferase (peptidoglycan interpeptide bridge formation enzyme)